MFDKYICTYIVPWGWVLSVHASTTALNVLAVQDFVAKMNTLELYSCFSGFDPLRYPEQVLIAWSGNCWGILK